MIRALFIAESMQVAEFWARELGIPYREFQLVSWHHDLDGVSREMPIYVCWPHTFGVKLSDIIEHARARGLTLIDAEARP